MVGAVRAGGVAAAGCDGAAAAGAALGRGSAALAIDTVGSTRVAGSDRTGVAGLSSAPARGVCSAGIATGMARTVIARTGTDAVADADLALGRELEKTATCISNAAASASDTRGMAGGERRRRRTPRWATASFKPPGLQRLSYCTTSRQLIRLPIKGGGATYA